MVDNHPPLYYMLLSLVRMLRPGIYLQLLDQLAALAIALCLFEDRELT